MTYEQAIKKIFIQNPFYGFVIMGLPVEESDKIPTAGVSLNKNLLTFELTVNPKFWASLTDRQQVEVFKHELLHICFYHCFLGKSFRDWDLFNIAADAEVNQYLDKQNLPEGCVDLIKQYPGLAQKAGAKFYYDFLQQQIQNQPSMPLVGGGQGLGQQTDSNNSNSSSGSAGNSSSGQNSKGTSGFGKTLDDHSAWKEMDELSEAEKELVSEALNKTLVEAYQNARGRGTVPGSLEEYIGKLLDRKQIFNWKAYFRRLVGNAEETWIKVSRKKESRRFSGGAGIKKVHYSNILVGVDTSGSVSTEELREFFTEMRHISKTKNVVVDVSEFDSIIHRTYRFSGKFTGKIEGRGGTNFQPVVDQYNANRKKYSALIIFTDGYAPIPEKTPKDCIWVITQNKEDKFPGKVIYMHETFNE